ncbi:MAG TPA: multidrug transporter [Pseudomonas xinjiangensis]|uniref:Multidrug transporter n=2 Tax=root TaxID=1 RepID=A0A7V1BNG9_9GAMM|nr:multidrug transporter [Halopseudomonas xinjiangensis]HEC48573.1 multidrug transporter [Halopseudomonas xinjiangensis]
MLFGLVLLLIWLVLLVRFPRITLPASAIVAGLALLLAIGAVFFQWLESRQTQQLDIDVRYSPDDCEFGKPLKVTVDNGSAKTAANISWRLLATQTGYNSNLLDISSSDATYRVDAALAPGQNWERCFDPPRLRTGYRAPDLEYRADRIRADFD